MPGPLDGLKALFSPESTYLAPEDEAMFRGWVNQNKDVPGVRDFYGPTKQDSKYDMRGFFNDKDALERWRPGEHFPDTYKQHGHPSFSNESKYSKGKSDGGVWVGDVLVPQPKRVW